ncbi:MAG: hydrolase 1, exosortase A system-associated [Sphingomonadales bacterium]
MAEQIPVIFDCHGDQLVGLLHQPDRRSETGVLIVVGGPQYRVGSHRQFLLLARRLAASGIAAMRFDCRGMGDSEGVFPGFEAIGPDIAAAADAFMAHCPGLRQIALWGLCDGASAALFHAPADPRICGLVLVNPWMRTETGIARAHLRHYYPWRLTSRDFWVKLGSGQFRLAASLKSLLHNLRQANPGNPVARPNPGRSLPDRMADHFERFDGPALLILSGDDLTAREFSDAARRSRRWRRILKSPNVTRHRITDADHTFSNCRWNEEMIDVTRQWVIAAIHKRTQSFESPSG